MNRFHTLVLAAIALLAVATSCKPTPKADPARVAQARIDSMEKALIQSIDTKAGIDSTGSDMEIENVLNLVKEYQLFSADFPKDTAASTYLLKQGQLFYNYLRDGEQAEKVFTHLIDSFPQAKNRPSALFFLANAQHDRGDTAAAQATLRRLVEVYPNTGAAKMAPQLSAMMRNGLPSEADSVTP